MVKLLKRWRTKTPGETYEQPNLSIMPSNCASKRLRMELPKLSRGMNEQKSTENERVLRLNPPSGSLCLGVRPLTRACYQKRSPRNQTDR